MTATPEQVANLLRICVQNDGMRPIVCWSLILPGASAPRYYATLGGANRAADQHAGRTLRWSIAGESFIACDGYGINPVRLEPDRVGE